MNEKILFTRDNIALDRDITYEEDYIAAYIEVWFDAEEKFNITLGEDEYVNVYASYYPKEHKLIVDYTYWDGSIPDHGGVYKDITKEEEELILQMMDEISIKETGMTILEHWKQIQNEEDI